MWDTCSSHTSSHLLNPLILTLAHSTLTFFSLSPIPPHPSLSLTHPLNHLPLPRTPPRIPPSHSSPPPRGFLVALAGATEVGLVAKGTLTILDMPDLFHPGTLP